MIPQPLDMGGWKQFEDDLGLFAIWLAINNDVFGRDIEVELFLPPKSESIRFLKSGLELTLSVVEIGQHRHHQICSSIIL